MKNKGWVKIWRGQYNNWISKIPFCDGYAWTYIYSQANYKKGMVNFRNEYIEIERGQFLTSKLKLQKIFGWTYRHIENFLLALKNDENITYRVSNRYIVITIINYERYQSNDEQNEEQSEEQSKNRLGTEQEQVRNSDTQLIRIKKEKKEKKEKKLSNIFQKCSITYQLVIYLEKKIRENNKAVKEKTESQLQSWCEDMDKLIRLDKANLDDIKLIIDWVVKDDFWSLNVLSAKKLREHYPRFYKKAINKTKSIKQKADEDPFDWDKALGEGDKIDV